MTGAALVVALLAAALAAALFVYHSRTSDLALEVPRLDRELGTKGGAKSPVGFEFFVRYEEPEAVVQIVGRGDEPVRDFGSPVALSSQERIECSWDGRDDEGDVVAPGNYRLRVVLPSQDRDMVFPLRILVRPNARLGGELQGPPCVRESGEPLR